MRKYRPPLTDNETAELERLSRLNFDGWSEADVREEFIVPLLILLGYRKDLDYSVSREESYRLNPLFIQLGRDRIKLDYICSVRKQKFWIIESKPGGYRTDTEIPQLTEEDIAQAHFYSLHPSVDTPYFVVTNGWFIHLYDREAVNEGLTPLLAFKHSDLPSEFMKLDAIIGATQLLYNLKQRILRSAEITLSAEVHLDRLDEFVQAMKMSVNTIRPKVFENFRKNAKIQEETRTEAVTSMLKTAPLDLIVSSVFMVSNSRGFMKASADILAQRVLDSPQSIQYLFMTNLLIEQTRPVRIPYYYNVLEFLTRVQLLDSTFTHKGQTIQSIIEDWVEMCLFHFWNRKDLRYMWLAEGMIGRLAIRLVYLTPQVRSAIISKTQSQIYLAPEEEVAWMGPSPAGNVIDFVEHVITVTLSNFVDKYMSERAIKEALIKEELSHLSKLVDTIEQQDDYKKIRSELGSSWGELRFYDSTNVDFDLLSSAICEILSEHPDVLNSLNDTIKKRIALQSSVGVVNYAKECLSILGDKYELESSKGLDVNDYFSPNKNPYSLLAE
ncbi:hypothetical protein [Alicyclobacillus acidoterrestris]|uniref:Type I restriction enzyme HsdR N-terminal domain-containing protein n=1 Tax=Alicyclobacillus acidoterrestris (strain ATCC 49025 / DSM 3922 / CIP 106132 / NCIMB 13137 / GD3B) TaxID=1356854 RepID=T0CJX2_ALIAG|nr:hypothetical protein [Alicyclobacillus acidoterrestris]EPZ53074.1 hypothetical protein N007_18265 [Alicyclobacillus acidoterrestris ATCC 49025]UNO49388.1 type I restriction enzyme HsdR N-terminal domain-containing protein [Alicyclobacillus acidoterrestris]